MIAKRSRSAAPSRLSEPNIRSSSPCITAALRAASRRLTMLYDDAMVPTGLRVTQYHVLSELERLSGAPPTVSELAEILIMERSALGQTLRPLERDGLVEFRRDEQDARRRPIVLTLAGRDAVTRARSSWAEAHRRFTAIFGETPMARLRTTLREIAESPTLSDAFEPVPSRIDQSRKSRRRRPS